MNGWALFMVLLFKQWLLSFSFLPIEPLASELGASFRMCGPFIKSCFVFPGNLYLCVWFWILLLFCCCCCCFYLSLTQNEVVKSETHSSNQSTHLLNRCFSIGILFFYLFLSFLIRQIFILQLLYAFFPRSSGFSIYFFFPLFVRNSFKYLIKCLLYWIKSTLDSMNNRILIFLLRN